MKPILRTLFSLMVFECISHGKYFVHGVWNDTCTTNWCSCCVDNHCGPGEYFNNTCLSGCIDGHRGARCYEMCTYNCKSCNNDISICENCYDGFYLGPRKDCTSKCLPNCKTCSLNSHCDTCKEGFYDRDGSSTCKYSSCPTNCECDETDCVSCKNGFYDIENSCNEICPPNCLACSSFEQCSQCQIGFYNGYESHSDIGRLLNDCTYKCRDECITCSSYDNCVKCRAGKYGLQCQENCAVGCKDKTCLIETGKCNCTFNFFGEKCTECVTGKYGNSCELLCPNNCNNKICDKSSGNCTEGCVNENMSGAKCYGCVDGKYGTLCNNICSANCRNRKCYKDSGNCSDGCENNFNGTTCTECVNGRYGNNCQYPCPDTCADNKCKRQSGDCFQCIGNFDGNKCDSCKPGFHGSSCDQNCSRNCLNNSCDKISGTCKYGCKSNYTGDKCCVNNNNCIHCSSNTECQECKSGYFQNLCERSCPVNCEGSCNFLTGDCMDCIINRFGPMCNLTCSVNCNVSQSDVSRCASTDGKCVHGCNYGFFGDSCNKTCKSLCIDNVCSQEKGVCIKGCSGSHEDPACPVSLGQTSTTSPSTSIGPIAGGVSGAAVAVIIGILFAIFFVKRRRTGKPSEQQSDGARTEHAREGPVYENFRETQLLEDDVERNSTEIRNDTSTAVEVNEVEIDRRSNDAASSPSDAYYNFVPNRHRVKVNDLFSYVMEHVDSFASEFGNLAKDLDLTQHCTFAKKPENLPLNRYNGIYPYDHSRVTISDQPGFFINACYIDGYNNRKKAYIASLGPTAKTTDKFSNFWLMVWNEKSDIIVMLTNLREASGMKCEKYWPELEKGEIYGQIKVTCRSIEDFAEYTVRTFSISKGKAERHVVQLHYTAWPDKGVPQEVTSLVEFRQRVKAVPLILGGPVIVHCSAGVGRTGTYIALDQLTEEGKCEGSVDVFNCVNRMREQRVNMVQTADQYKFLYKSLVHSLSFGCEALTAEEIQGFTYKADGHLFIDMFETLRQEVDIESKEDTEDRQENRRRHKDKNRRHSDIPAHRSRVRLYLARADGHHDYINAVFINSFRTKNLFIAAQSPLPGTVEDFVCMIYQQNSSCVVDLEESHDQNDVGKYLPADNETYKCGDFTVTSSKCETKKQYILKKVSIKNTKKSEEKSVYHFKYTKWGRSKTVPDSVEDFVHFIKDVEKIVNRQTEDQPHIVAHCLSGYERTGLFCVVYKLLEKLEAERQVSVVNTVRKIRTHRKQSITSVEQLKFCYQCISAYLEMYNTYSNFAT